MPVKAGERLMPESSMSDAEVLESFEAVSNWGRWGAEDELGTLNYITPARVVAAGALVRSGRVVSAAHDLSTVPSAKNSVPLHHRMIYRGAHAHGAADEMLVYNHGLFQTHVDALAHHFFEEKVYNGRAVDDVVQARGLSFGSVYAQRNGLVTRGVLLDVARARGVDWLEPTDTVTASDLQAAEDLTGTTVESGDAVLVRIGLGRREATSGPEDVALRAGLGPDCAPWLHEREVALFGSDCPEKLPSAYPAIGLTWHIAALVFMGLVLVDTLDMEAVADACAEEGTSEFLYTQAPLRFAGGTGCPINPLCVF
jgi:kynurenine formamidase